MAEGCPDGGVHRRRGRPPGEEGCDQMAGDSTIRQQLVEGTIETIRRHGIAGTSRRTIAHTAGVNEALISAHFTSLHELLAAASRLAAQSRAAAFRDRFDGVTSLRQVLVLGRELWAEERERGSMIVLSQLLAAAHDDPELAEATNSALQLWVAEIERVIRRLLADSPVPDLVDPASAARAVCASFVGLSMFGAVDNGAGPFDLLEPLAGMVDEIKPLERKLLYARLRARNDRRR
ncbi:MAG: TetR/AcrR family transcriptional regulator [Nocardioidaceae bacterium]